MARRPASAVFILWLRQLKLYLRSHARMAGSLGQLFRLALGFGLRPTFARAGRGSYVQFLAPGIAVGDRPVAADSKTTVTFLNDTVLSHSSYLALVESRPFLSSPSTDGVAPVLSCLREYRF